MIRLTAHAKINFHLEITGKRPDGYHTLETVFQTLVLGDELTFEPADALTLTCSDASLRVDETNLVMRAALRLKEALREPRGARIHLNKISPMGAGLGGGSSDAAATLKGLQSLWGKSLPQDALKSLALKLGADVPFFLTGGLCLATGIGEVLTPLPPMPQTWMVIVWPGFGVSTKEAYSRVVIPPGHKGGIHPFSWTPGLHKAGDPSSAGVMSGNLFNRFEEFVFPFYPALPKLKQEFLAEGAKAALMSGSGSAVFGLVESKAAGEKVLKTMQTRYPHAWLTSTI